MGSYCSHLQHRWPQVEAGLAMGSQNTKKCINLLSFRVGPLKHSSKVRIATCISHIECLEGSEKWKRKRRYRTCFLYPRVSIITTKIHCLRVQVKMYLFQKESNTFNPIPPPSTAQFGNLYYSAFRIIVRHTTRII